MAAKHSNPVVGTTATALIGSVVDGTDKSETARRVTITNPSGTVSVFLGGSNVTSTAFGYELKFGERVSFELVDGDEIYGVVTAVAVSQQVNILHLGV